jgi:hypothetical protein
VHRLSSAFVLGYHGCDRTTAEALLAGTPFTPSENDWDWLGHGIYFWESNPVRGIEFAVEWQARGKIAEPYVVGAVIDLGFCLDLISSTGISAVKGAYLNLVNMAGTAGRPMLRNRGRDDDRLLRELDCAVINHLHQIRTDNGLPPFDSVRGVFVEGGRIYEDAGFFAKTHIQICVRDPACIKGVFRVPDGHLQG